jgi:hypothetical protein
MTTCGAVVLFILLRKIMLKLSKIASYAALILIAFTTQFASAAPTAADRAFLGFTTPAFTIGGTVQGLKQGNQLVLFNNGSDELFINKDGQFTFNMAVAEGSGYKVTVAMQPQGQFCLVSYGEGIATGNVTNIKVECKSV